MAVALANARQAVAAPVRKPRTFGLFSVVDIIDGGDSHWLLGGITADGEECSRPEGTSIVCGPTPNKDSRSWYSDLDADPWLAYMFETCKTVGRFDEAAARLRTRFLASEQSAVETEFQDNVLDTATSLGAFPSVLQAVANLEANAASEYGGQITLHLGFQAAAQAFTSGAIHRIGDHLETNGGNLVSIGNYHADHSGRDRHRPRRLRHRGDDPLPQRSDRDRAGARRAGRQQRLQQRLLRADRAWVRSPGGLLHGQRHRHPL